MAHGNRFCTHCNRTNHTINTCFIKHGYPLGFKSRKPTAPSSTSSSLGFTSAQIQSLMTLLHSSAPTPTATISLASAQHVAPDFTGSGNSLSLWLIDSGATDHIASSLHFFATYKAIRPVSVSLPNGTKTIASYSGTIFLTPDLILYDVLYLPDFSKNIISVGRLQASKYCQVLFVDNECLIQERPSLRTIGNARLDGMLFSMVIDFKPSSSSVSAVHCTGPANPAVNIDLWHHRLGHPSADCLSLVHKQNSNIPNCTHIACDACHLMNPHHMMVFNVKKRVLCEDFNECRKNGNTKRVNCAS